MLPTGTATEAKDTKEDYEATYAASLDDIGKRIVALRTRALRQRETARRMHVHARRALTHARRT
ncbi:hypothetical protein [Streptomyces sp. NPDC046939]|uniref:hypothetical protein n=1 Tax=Streptomyces sp. NPDC046939 TaxID=3155376 RepID=UPI0033C5F3A5